MRIRRQFLGIFLAIAGVVAVLPAGASAAEVNFKSDTLFRYFQRDTKTDTDAAVAPAYEYLQLNAGALDAPGFSFHLSGWGRLDLASNHYFDDPTDGELLYGYLQYQNEKANFDARLGRQLIFGGVANDTVDGLLLSSDLGRFFSASIYGGQPAALDSEQGRSGDSIYGGRLSHHYGALYDVGLSYKKIRNDSNDATEKLGIDLGVNGPKGISLSGLSSYNLVTDGWGEHTYALNFSLAGIAFRPYFEQFLYEDMFGTDTANAKTTPNPFRYLQGTGERLTIVGTDLTWRPKDSVELGAKVKNYDYKVMQGTSQYYSLLANWHGEGLTEVGGEAGVMRGDADENKYYLLRAFTYLEDLPDALPLAFLSGDVVFVKYDQNIYNQDSSLFVSLGAGQRFFDKALEVKISGDYSKDPYFDHDLRGLLTVSYAFNRSL